MYFFHDQRWINEGLKSSSYQLELLFCVRVPIKIYFCPIFVVRGPKELGAGTSGHGEWLVNGSRLQWSVGTGQCGGGQWDWSVGTGQGLVSRPPWSVDPPPPPGTQLEEEPAVQGLEHITEAVTHTSSSMIYSDHTSYCHTQVNMYSGTIPPAPDRLRCKLFSRSLGPLHAPGAFRTVRTAGDGEWGWGMETCCRG